MKGNLVYLYAALRALAGWKHAHFHGHGRRRAPRVTGYSVAVAQLEGLRRRHVRRARRPSSTTASSTCHVSRRPSEADASCATCRRCSRAPTSTIPHVAARCAARRSRSSADRPVHHLRRRRPDRRPARHRDASRRARCASSSRAADAPPRASRSPASLRARQPPRRPQRRHHARPGRVLLRLEPSAIARLAARPRRGAVLVSATNGKTTTAAMLAAILERAGAPVVHNRAGSNMHWGVATALLDAGRGAAASSACSRSTRPGSPPVASELDPRSCCCPTCSATSSTATASSSCWPTAGRSWSAERDGRTRFVLNADDPLVADLGRERERRRLLRRGGRLAGAARAAARRRLEALPQLRPRLRLRGRLPRATWAATAARTAAASGPRPQVVGRRRSSSHGMTGLRRASSRTPAGPLERAPPAPRPLQRLQRAGRHGRRAGAGRAARRRRARRSRASAAPSGGSSDPDRRPREVSILLVKNPAGANEVLRTLTLEDGAARPLARAERPDRRRPRRLVDLGRRLRAAGRAACGASPAPGTRAEEMALRLKYAGVEAADRGRARPRPLARRGRGGRRPAGPLYALPTYTALLELRDLLAAARPRGAVVGMSSAADAP